MEELSMLNKMKPEVIIIAGPNGSGKSTITKMASVKEPYINADDIKRTNHCSDLEAAQIAESLRERSLNEGVDFSFETVLSTERNLDLLRRAKAKGYFIRCIYILTTDPEINVFRVRSRVGTGGHSVPEDKIRSRYYKALSLIPQLVEICDIVHLYDNSDEPFRIFKKRKEQLFYWQNDYWTEDEIKKLTGTV